jgi:hypothetical protein
MSAAAEEAVLFEIDKKGWETLLDRTERWFHHVQMVQTAFRKLAEDTLPKMHDSHLRQYLTEILERAKDHESKTDDLLRMIGRDPSASRKAMGTGLAKAQELVADVKGFAGGAVSGWRDLQQLVHASLDGIAVFGVAQDLGLALGLVEVTELTMHISNEKFVHHYLLQELVLELGTMSVLYRSEI